MNGASKSSEIYDITTNQWTRLPDLNYHSQSVSVILVNERLLFKFTGSLMSPSIEYLDLASFLDSKCAIMETWQILNVSLHPHDMKFMNTSLKMITDSKVLITSSSEGKSVIYDI